MEVCDTINIVQQITMQNEILAVEEAMKIEVAEVKIKTETAEVESELLFGIEQTRRPRIKYADTDETVVNRSKEGHIVQNWKNNLEMQVTKAELGEDVNYEELKIECEELINKDENDDLNDANVEIDADRIKKEQVVKVWKNDLEMEDTEVKLEEDVNYEELKIESKELIIKVKNDDLNDANVEIDVDRSLEIPCGQNQHLKTADKLTCTQCNKAFKRKLNLDDHTVRKHPHLIASVSSKIHECTHCMYKSTLKSSLDSHMLKHSKTNDKLSACIHCNAKYKNKANLDDHIIRKHPEYIASVSHKIHECTKCSYKTAIKANFDYHIFRHSETAVRYMFSTCIYCNAKYRHKINLDNHKLKQHPEYIVPISRKVHECTHCSFITVRKAHLACHMSKHPKTADRYNFSTCMHCNATFKSKRALDDHTLRKHPDFVGSISSKMHECMHCAFKTVKIPDLARHMLNHPETADGYNFSSCTHCNATFKSKQDLDDHMLRKHPDSIGFIATKIHECMHCAFKTVRKAHFARHVSKHPETADGDNFGTCTQ